MTLKRSTSAYELAVRSVPAFCIAGIAVAIVGHVFGFPLVRKIGTGTLLFGFAVWCFANGLSHLWGLVRTIRQDGFRAFSDEPWSSTFYVLTTITALIFGGFLVWWAFSGIEFSE
jgi:hypothetical protein